jgi:GSH-dependent disulfide-bond oxidoreductase
MSLPIELYYWPTPNGWKISIALEEMDLPYAVVPVNIGAGDQFKPDFLKISPNNRMPAIIDPAGPEGAPISVFESGAILRYLAAKSGLFYAKDIRGQAEIDQWLFWQVSGLGPMAGQAHHFRSYAAKVEPDPSKLEYGKRRYTDEVHRLYGVLERALKDRDFIAGDYSIADMAIWPWILPEGQGQDLNEFPNLTSWVARVGERPAVKAGRAVAGQLRTRLDADSKEAEEARRVLFGQRAQSI